MRTYDPITGRLRQFMSAVPLPPNDPIALRRESDVPDAFNVPLYRSYAAGLQCDSRDDKQKEAMGGLPDHDFADNICQPILSIASDRIELERFDVPGEIQKDENGHPIPNPLETYLHEEVFVKNHLDAMQSEISYSVLRDGSHYVGVGWPAPANRAVWVDEPAWDGDTGMHVFYDTDGLPEFAVKEYIKDTSEDPQRPNLTRFRVSYYPGLITYQKIDRNGTGQEWQEDEPDAVWTVNGQAGGLPLGIPVFHFSNASRTGRPHGDSELSGGVIGLQDQINDAHWDLAAAGRYTAYQRTWSAGWDGTDGQGNAVQLDTLPGGNAAFVSADARVGVIPAGDCSQLIKIIHEKRETACRMTGTPIHLVTVGAASSGAAIVNAEAPLENKAKKVANKIAPSYASAAYFSVVLANAKGAQSLPGDVMIQAVMAATSRRDPMSIAQQAMALVGVLDHASVLELLGYQPTRIAEIIVNRKAEAAEAASLLPTPVVAQ